MVDATQTQNQQQDDLQRRREEKIAEQFAQDSACKLSEIATTSLAMWQKQLDVTTQMAKFWSDALQNNQRAFHQVIDQFQNATSNIRRSA